jgi:hypothetical protein
MKLFIILHTTIYVLTYERYRMGQDWRRNATIIAHLFIFIFSLQYLRLGIYIFIYMQVYIYFKNFLNLITPNDL